MFPNSVVARTGQVWKLWLSILVMLFGSFAPLWERSGINWTVGTILMLAGYAFGVWFIACPACRRRWFWSAALDAGLYAPLFKQPTCPHCRRAFAAR
jgi:hypothetical protein